MAVQNLGPSKTYKAGADFTAKLWRIVKQSADDTVVLASAATDKVVGVIANKAKSGELVEVIRFNGGVTFKVVLGTGGATRGAFLVADANAAAVIATQQTAGQQPTSMIIGRALQAGSAGDIIEVEGGVFAF
jgi:hypothetical protein